MCVCFGSIVGVEVFGVLVGGGGDWEYFVCVRRCVIRVR